MQNIQVFSEGDLTSNYMCFEDYTAVSDRIGLIDRVVNRLLDEKEFLLAHGFDLVEMDFDGGLTV